MKIDDNHLVDTDDALVHIAKMADQDLNRARDGHLVSSLSRVVVQLAERVAALTVEVRRLKQHDAQAVATWDNGEPNEFGNFRGVCTCGWATEWNEHAVALGFVTKHRAFYAEQSPANGDTR